MKTFLFLLSIGLFSLYSFIPGEFNSTRQESPNQLNGAWTLMAENGDVISNKVIKILSNEHFLSVRYDPITNEFIGAEGGVYEIEDNNYIAHYEFSTIYPEKTEEPVIYDMEITGKIWYISGKVNGKKMILKWQRLDEGKSKMAGAWRIRERQRDGEMRPMRRGPRKTLKMLSDTRFQWAAFNSETGDFFGTGGGTYELKDGSYIEKIEVFSRDSSRVGAELKFGYELKNGDWHHKGKSSRGDPIYEIWEEVD